MVYYAGAAETVSKVIYNLNNIPVLPYTTTMDGSLVEEILTKLDVYAEQSPTLDDLCARVRAVDVCGFLEHYADDARWTDENRFTLGYIMTMVSAFLEDLERFHSFISAQTEKAFITKPEACSALLSLAANMNIVHSSVELAMGPHFADVVTGFITPHLPDSTGRLPTTGLAIPRALRQRSIPEGTLDSMCDVLRSGKVLVVHGEAGCGRASIADAVAHQMMSERQYDVALNVPARAAPADAMLHLILTHYLPRTEAAGLGSTTLRRTHGDREKMATYHDAGLENVPAALTAIRSTAELRTHFLSALTGAGRVMIVLKDADARDLLSFIPAEVLAGGRGLIDLIVTTPAPRTFMDLECDAEGLADAVNAGCVLVPIDTDAQWAARVSDILSTASDPLGGVGPVERDVLLALAPLPALEAVSIAELHHLLATRTDGPGARAGVDLDTIEAAVIALLEARPPNEEPLPGLPEAGYVAAHLVSVVLEAGRATRVHISSTARKYIDQACLNDPTLSASRATLGHLMQGLRAVLGSTLAHSLVTLRPVIPHTPSAPALTADPEGCLRRAVASHLLSSGTVALTHPARDPALPVCLASLATTPILQAAQHVLAPPTVVRLTTGLLSRVVTAIQSHGHLGTGPPTPECDTLAGLQVICDRVGRLTPLTGMRAKLTCIEHAGPLFTLHRLLVEIGYAFMAMNELAVAEQLLLLAVARETDAFRLTSPDDETLPVAARCVFLQRAGQPLAALPFPTIHSPTLTLRIRKTHKRVYASPVLAEAVLGVAIIHQRTEAWTASAALLHAVHTHLAPPSTPTRRVLADAYLAGVTAVSASPLLSQVLDVLPTRRRALMAAQAAFVPSSHTPVDITFALERAEASVLSAQAFGALDLLTSCIRQLAAVRALQDILAVRDVLQGMRYAALSVTALVHHVRDVHSAMSRLISGRAFVEARLSVLFAELGVAMADVCTFLTSTTLISFNIADHPLSGGKGRRLAFQQTLDQQREHYEMGDLANQARVGHLVAIELYSIAATSMLRSGWASSDLYCHTLLGLTSSVAAVRKEDAGWSLASITGEAAGLLAALIAALPEVDRARHLSHRPYHPAAEDDVQLALAPAIDHYLAPQVALPYYRAVLEEEGRPDDVYGLTLGDIIKLSRGDVDVNDTDTTPEEVPAPPAGPDHLPSIWDEGPATQSVSDSEATLYYHRALAATEWLLAAAGGVPDPHAPLRTTPDVFSAPSQALAHPAVLRGIIDRYVDQDTISWATHRQAQGAVTWETLGTPRGSGNGASGSPVKTPRRKELRAAASSAFEAVHDLEVLLDELQDKLGLDEPLADASQIVENSRPEHVVDTIYRLAEAVREHQQSTVTTITVGRETVALRQTHYAGELSGCVVPQVMPHEEARRRYPNPSPIEVDAGRRAIEQSVALGADRRGVLGRSAPLAFYITGQAVQDVGDAASNGAAIAQQALARAAADYLADWTPVQAASAPLMCGSAFVHLSGLLAQHLIANRPHALQLYSAALRQALELWARCGDVDRVAAHAATCITTELQMAIDWGTLQFSRRPPKLDSGPALLGYYCAVVINNGAKVIAGLKRDGQAAVGADMFATIEADAELVLAMLEAAELARSAVRESSLFAGDVNGLLRRADTRQPLLAALGLLATTAVSAIKVQAEVAKGPEGNPDVVVAGFDRALTSLGRARALLGAGAAGAETEVARLIEGAVTDVARSRETYVKGMGEQPVVFAGLKIAVE